MHVHVFVEEQDVWHWIVTKWRLFLARHRMRRELAPDTLRKLTEEIKDIARVSGQVWCTDQGLQERVNKICHEMDQLNRLLDKSSFRRLPEDTKKELRSNLLISRDELLKNLHSAPCPTDKIQ